MRRNESLERFYSLCLFVAGFVLRIYFIMTNAFYSVQHDVGQFNMLLGDDGHAGYIEHFVRTFALPTVNPMTTYQFSHPPLHHFLDALWMKFQMFLGADVTAAAKSLQHLSLIYNMLTLYFLYKILKLFGLKKRALYLALSILLFHPYFVFMAGGINNDMLSTLFMSMTLYFGLKWYKDRRFKSFFITGLCIGFGMMTKITVAIVIPFVGFLMIMVLIDTIKDKKGDKTVKQLLLEYIGTVSVSAVIGLWFHVYYYIRWNMPFGYVWQLGEDDSVQSIADVSIWRRLFDFTIGPVYEQWRLLDHTGLKHVTGTYNDYNIPVVIAKNSIFGEYVGNRDMFYDKVKSVGESMASHVKSVGLYTVDGIANVLFITNIFLMLLSVFAMILCLRYYKKRSKKYVMFFGIFVFYMTMMGVYLMNAFKYPFVCTMDFRYIVLTVFVGVLFIGFLVQCLETRNKYVIKQKALKIGLTSVEFIVFLFCALSVVMILGFPIMQFLL